MNVKLKLMGVGAVFFLGGLAFAQDKTQTKKKKDTLSHTQIEEVVILGFGQKKSVKETTGAISTIKGDMVENVPAASIDKMLGGRIAGVQTGNVSGQPGGLANVRIRGIASVNGNREPLYIIDGVRVISGDLTRGATTGNVLANLNNDDIESITVLKDAASTAVYGADAGAGVVLINTKSGKKGLPKIDLTFNSGFGERAIKGLEGLNADEWKYLLSYEYANNYNVTPATAIQNAITGTYGATAKSIFTSSVNSNWQKAIDKKSAYQQSFSGSISGGNDNVTYYTSLNYFTQEANVRGSDFRRVAATNKVSFKINPKMTLSTDLQLSYSRINTMTIGGAFSNPMLAGVFLRPTDPIYNNDGTYYLGVNGRLSNSLFNPLYLAEHNYYRAETERIFGNLSYDYNIIKNLNYKFVFGGEFINIENNVYWNPYHGDGYNLNGRKSEGADRWFNFNVQNILSYNFRIADKHNFEFRAIQEAYKRNDRYISAVATVTATGLETLNNFIKPTSNNGNIAVYSRQGYAGMFNYNYDKIINLDASIRREALSQFQDPQKWGTFYSVGLGIDLAKISYIKNSKLTTFKLRGSYGKIGNQLGDNVVPYSMFYYTQNYNDLAAGYPNFVNNPNLRWETIKPLSIGLDIGVLKDRVTLSVDYFNKETSDLIFNVPIQLSQGLGNYSIAGQAYYFDNVGKLKNKGIEVSLNADIIKKDNLIWSLGGNFNTLTNTLTKLYGGSDIISGSTILREGEAVGTFYMRKWAGVDSSNGNPLWYKNGVDGETTTNYNDAQLAVQGKAFNDVYGGIYSDINYKGFFVNVLVSYGFGGKVLNDWASYTRSDGQYTLSYPGDRDQLDFWRPDNTNALNPKPIIGNTTLSNRTSTRFLSKTDYFRLSNIKIGYKFSRSFLEGSGLRGCEVYVQGNNIWTYLYDKSLRFDPENNLNTSNNLNLPVLKTFSFGVNVQF